MEVDLSHGSKKLVSNPSHPVLRLSRRLRERRVRDRTRLVFAEGVRLLVAAHEFGASFRHLVVSPRLLTSSPARQRIQALAEAGVPITRVTPEAFRQLSTARRASGVAAVLQQRWLSLNQLTPEPGDMWLGIRSIDSPGNLGTMLRTALGCGLRGVMLFGNEVDPYNPAVVRASMGAIAGLEMVRTVHSALDRRRTALGVQVIGCDGAATARFWEPDLSTPTVLLAGNERKGLTDEERAMCDALVQIPMAPNGVLTSLNVAVAASVVMVEAQRQRMAGRVERPSK